MSTGTIFVYLYIDLKKKKKKDFYWNCKLKLSKAFVNQLYTTPGMYAFEYCYGYIDTVRIMLLQAANKY